MPACEDVLVMVLGHLDSFGVDNGYVCRCNTFRILTEGLLSTWIPGKQDDY